MADDRPAPDALRPSRQSRAHGRELALLPLCHLESYRPDERALPKLSGTLQYNLRQTEAIFNLKRALSIYEKLGRIDDVAGCHSILGQIYYDSGNLPGAKTELLAAVRAYANTVNVEYRPSTYQLLGAIGSGEKEYPKAENYLRQGLRMAQQFDQQDRIFEILKVLTKTEYALGKPADAYRSLSEAFAIRDTVVEQKRLALMEEMQTKFDVEKKLEHV